MNAFEWESEEHRCAADAYGPWSEYDGFDHDECEDGNPCRDCKRRLRNT